MNAITEEQIAFALLLIIIWVGPMTMVALIEKIDKMVLSLGVEYWHKIYDAASVCSWRIVDTRSAKQSMTLVESLPNNISEKTVALISLRLETQARNMLCKDRLINYQGNDICVLDVCKSFALSGLLSESNDPDAYLSLIERGYKGGALFDENQIYEWNRSYRTRKMDLSVAKRITENAEEFPPFLLTVAEEVCQSDTATKIVPVGIIAQRESWSFA